MAYTYGSSDRAKKTADPVQRNAAPDMQSRSHVADGFYEGWNAQRNEDGTCNAGKADLDALLAYVMFHGKAVLDAEVRVTRFGGLGIVNQCHYRVPLAGILAEAALRGRELLERKTAESDDFPWPGPWELDTSSTNPKSQQDRVNRMLTGVATINPGWLVQLASGLEMEAQPAERFWRMFGSTKVEGGVPNAHRITSFVERHVVLETQRKQKETTRRRAVIRQADYAIFDAIREAIDRLDELPRGYPAALGVRTLAEMLRATTLEPGWEQEYEKVQSLYSGLQGYGVQPAMKLVSGHRDVMVLGDPGHGKSTLLAGLALNALDQGAPVLYARLDDLGRVAAEDSFKPSKWNLEWAMEMLMEAAAASSLNLRTEVWSKAINALSREPDLVVVLDGWDEVSTEERRLVVERVLQILTGSWAGGTRAEGMAGRLIVASRVTGYRRPVPAITEILLTLMDPTTVLKFFETWFADEVDSDGLSRVREALLDERFAEVARIPVLAGFIAVVAKDEKPRTTKQGLYEQYLRRFLVRGWRGGRFIQRSPADINDRLGVATKLAWRMATWPTKDPYRVDQWEDHLSADRLGDWTPPGGFPSQREWYRQVVMLATEDGLLVPHGRLRDDDPGSQHFRWLHRTIHEHLVGRRLMEILRDEPDEGLARIRQSVSRNSWSEALEHCAGFVANAGLHQLVVDDLFSYSTGINPLDERARSTLVTFVRCSGSEYRRNELIGLLVKAEDWRSAEELDPEEFAAQIRGIDVRALTDWGATNLGWKIADVGDIELMERLIGRDWTSESGPDSLQLHYYSALRRKDPVRAQLTAIQDYREQKIGSLPTPIMQGATTVVVEELSSAIQAASSFYDVSVYIEALAKSGHFQAKEHLDKSLDGAPHATLLLEMFETLQPTGAFKNILPALEISRFSAELIEKILSSSAPDYIAFFYAFSLPDQARQQKTLTPWARAGYWAGVFANVLDHKLDGDWSSRRASAAIDKMLQVHERPTGEAVADFYQAVIWSATNMHMDDIRRISAIGARGDYRKERWNWWIWDQFFHALRVWLEGYDWPFLFEAWKVWNIENDGSVDLDRILSLQAPHQIEECLMEVIEWYVYTAPQTSHFPHYLPPPVVENVHEKALIMLNLLPNCTSSNKSRSLLAALTMWMQIADTLPSSWELLKSAWKEYSQP